MRLYSNPISGHSHRARLFLSLLGVEFELIDIDLAGRQQKSAEFLAINSFGQVPVLVHKDAIIADSNAILVYLAKKYNRTDWLPEDSHQAARIQKWLSVAAGEIVRGPGAARLITLLKAPFPVEETIARSHNILNLIEVEFATKPFISGDQPTIADVALYSYIASAPEGNVDLAGYPKIRAWLTSIESLPGFIPFQKNAVGLFKAGQ